MPVIKGIVEYDGTNYSGWQKQINSNSIQSEIEKALQNLFQEEIIIVGAGRTDSGVHALNQVFHFKTNRDVNLEKLKKSLNGVLQGDISIKKLEFEKNDFHARYSAKSRTYLYLISKRKNVFFDRYSWTIYSDLNLKLALEIQKIFVGRKNFTSFCKAEHEIDNKFCNVYYSRWFYRPDLLMYFITADRFIHGMVRGIVGLTVEYMKGKLNIEEVESILDGKNRCPLWAPSKGLILYKVGYQED